MYFSILCQPGVLAGDIYARVKIEAHPVFVRKGADLTIIRNISLLEALTGVTMTINHLNGKQYTIATAPGQILANKVIKTIRKLGMPFYKDAMSYGNLHVEFLVDFPPEKSLNSDTKKKIQTILAKIWGNKIKENRCEPLKQESQNKTLVDFSDELVNKSPNYPRGHENE